MPLTNRAASPREARRVSPDRLFRLDTPTAPTLARRVTNAAAPSLERLLYVSGINDIYDAVRHETDRGLFIQGVLEFLDVRLRVSSDDLARVPKTGPAVVVANHPFGAIEGILMARLLASVRDDVKIMANFLLHRIPQLRDLFIFVDPFGGESAAARNVRPLREAIRWVRGGGLLVVFPAGEVAHLDVKRRQVLDPAWSPTVGRIARKTAAPVVPMFFTGHNSAAFQLAGLLHPRLRTALLPRELMNKRHKTLEVRVGSPVPARKLASFEGDAEATDYLRQRAYMLRHRPPGSPRPSPSPPTPSAQQPVVAESDPALLAREVAALPAAQKLPTADGLAVYEAAAGQIPGILQEIGRLREITFRATGEGTGNAHRPRPLRRLTTRNCSSGTEQDPAGRRRIPPGPVGRDPCRRTARTVSTPAFAVQLPGRAARPRRAGAGDGPVVRAGGIPAVATPRCYCCGRASAGCA